MSDHITISLEKRDVLGKAVKQLRREGTIPAVIHDHGKESVHVQGAYLPLLKAYHAAGKHQTVNLTVDGKKYLALIKDATFEPRKNDLRHLVFASIKQNEKVTTEVPLQLSEEIPALQANLNVLTHLEAVTVEGFPKDLVDVLVIDASGLHEVGDKLTIADITVPAGLTIQGDPETVIATVEMPRDQLAEANTAAAEQAVEDGKAPEATGTSEASTDSADKPAA